MGLPNVLNDLWSHIAETLTAHGATSNAAAGRIIVRDSAGRAKINAPSAAADIANKDYVDDKVAGEAAARASAINAINSGNSGNISGLTSQLNAEIAARKAADTSLQTQIDKIGSGGGGGSSSLNIYVRTAYIDAIGKWTYAPGPPNQLNFAFSYTDLYQEAGTGLVVLTNVVKWNGSSN